MDLTHLSSQSDLDTLTVQVSEIFFSIQGESTYAGRPCIFIRLTGCNLRCTYCDTKYSYYGGERLSLNAVLNKISEWNCDLVEITGGEPLLQRETPRLASELLRRGHTVLIETSGAEDISVLDPRVVKIMDLKTPASGEVKRNRWENIAHLSSRDEVKFVIGDRHDYEWAKDIFATYLEHFSGTVLFSPFFGGMPYADLARWILEDQLPVRMQLQLHKFIWHPEQRGV